VGATEAPVSQRNLSEADAIEAGRAVFVLGALLFSLLALTYFAVMLLGGAV